MRFISFLILCLVALFTFSFAVLNAQKVPIDYYVGTSEIPLSILLVATFVVGMLIGMSLLLPTQLRLKFEIRRLHHRDGN